MKCRLKIEQGEIQVEAVLKIDRTKFTDQLAEEINKFQTGSNDRLDLHGSHFNAALKLYAEEIFNMSSGDFFISEDYITRRFDWSNGNGIEGFESFENAGIQLIRIDAFHVDCDMIELDIEETDDETI